MTGSRFLVVPAVLGAILVAGVAAAGAPARGYDKSFLTDYDLLQPRPGKTGEPTELWYEAPDAVRRMAAYTAVMVDQPVVHFSPDSEIKGMKPDDLRALAENIRDALSARLAEGGYTVVEQPGPGVLYLRLALTDLIVKNKQRRLLSYTPVGFVVKTAADAVRETFDKVDFIEVTLQAEIIDSVSSEALMALVSPHGERKAPGQTETRIDMEQLNQKTRVWGLRLRCHLDNVKLPADRQADCTDDEANIRRYGR
jgi:hypothetical protein